MKQLIIITSAFFLCIKLHGQVILNGDFENTAITECKINLDNASFTNWMPGCYAFGPGNELDIWDSSHCIWYGTAQHGRRFVSVHSRNPTYEPDGFSLKIFPPLAAGTMYQLTYYEKAFVEVSGIDSLDSLLITLSTDSLQTGLPIFTSQPLQQEWTLQSVPFISPANISYITVSNKGRKNGWNYVDNFQISSLITMYKFTGNGNWSDTGNWLNGIVPSSTLAAGSTISIDPTPGGECILNVPYTLALGCTLIIEPGKSLLIKENISITSRN